MSSRNRPSLTAVLARLALCGAVLAGAVALAPSPHAHAAPAPTTSAKKKGGTGLHDGMMPPDSPDAKVTLGGTRAGPMAAGPMISSGGTTTTLGIDVSHWQHPGTAPGAPIDWTQVAGSGQAFAIVKATELYTDSGTGQPVLYTNPWLHTDLDAATAAGLVVGAYAFAHPENDPVAQADDFAAAVGTLPAGSLPPVLDLEVNGGLSPSALVNWTRTFLLRVEGDTGVVPMIYAGPNFWAASLGGSTAFTSYPLWEANYTSAAAPNPMGGWSTYTLWQWTDSAAVPGITLASNQSGVDQSRFQGTPTDLASIAQAAGPQAIAARVADAATAASLGAATSAVACGPTTGGCRQSFTNRASIYWSPQTGAHVVHAAIRDKWNSFGAETGFLGYPTTDEVALTNGSANVFQGGAIYWSAATGAHMVHGAIRQKWGDFGYEAGFLGYPTSDEIVLKAGAATTFQGGAIYWSAPTGAHMVHGAIRQKWNDFGADTGFLGYPTSDEIALSNGAATTFQGGAIYWSAATGAHMVHGAIRSAWVATGAETGYLGYPTTDEYAVTGGSRENFQGGYITWTPITGAIVTRR